MLQTSSSALSKVLNFASRPSLGVGEVSKNTSVPWSPQPRELAHRVQAVPGAQSTHELLQDDTSMEGSSINQKKTERVDKHGSNQILWLRIVQNPLALFDVRQLKHFLPNDIVAIPDMNSAGFHNSRDGLAMSLCVVLFVLTLCGMVAAVHAWAYEEPI